MNNFYEPPEAVLHNFLERMAEWEKSFFSTQMNLIENGQSTVDCDADYRSRLQKIFQDFSLEEAKTWARLDGMGCTDPSMYDPARDPIKVEGLKGKTWVAIVEQVAGLRAVFRFSLVETSVGWRIKRKDTFRDGKWYKSTL